MNSTVILFLSQAFIPKDGAEFKTWTWSIGENVNFRLEPPHTTLINGKKRQFIMKYSWFSFLPECMTTYPYGLFGRSCEYLFLLLIEITEGTIYNSDSWKCIHIIIKTETRAILLIKLLTRIAFWTIYISISNNSSVRSSVALNWKFLKNSCINIVLKRAQGYPILHAWRP